MINQYFIYYLAVVLQNLRIFIDLGIYNAH